MLLLDRMEGRRENENAIEIEFEMKTVFWRDFGMCSVITTYIKQIITSHLDHIPPICAQTRPSDGHPVCWSPSLDNQSYP